MRRLETELKTCPFCGHRASLGEGERLPRRDENGRFYYIPAGYFVRCENSECYCHLGMDDIDGSVFGFFETAEDALNAWNKRAD